MKKIYIYKKKPNPVFSYNTDEGEVVRRRIINYFLQSLLQNELVFIVHVNVEIKF